MSGDQIAYNARPKNCCPILKKKRPSEKIWFDDRKARKRVGAINELYRWCCIFWNGLLLALANGRKDDPQSIQTNGNIIK
jgi:hypothetical protein